MRPVELVRRSDAAPALPAAAQDVEVERSVRDRLYGQRGAITATPIAHGAARTDLFSLGAVAYRLLLGPAVPADPCCTAPLTTAVPRRAPLSEGIPGLPRGVYEAVQQALAPEPAARQESAAAFRAQLLDGHAPSREPWRGGVVPFPDAVRSQVRSAA